MAVTFELPLTPWSTQNVVLGDSTFIFEYEWSNRYDTWYLSIYDSENNPLLLGVRLVPWEPILQNHPQAGLPSGDLVLYDTESDVGEGDTYPNFDNLRTRFTLQYFSEEELET